MVHYGTLPRSAEMDGGRASAARLTPMPKCRGPIGLLYPGGGSLTPGTAAMFRTWRARAWLAWTLSHLSLSLSLSLYIYIYIIYIIYIYGDVTL